MSWEIIKEHKRTYADTSYYLKAERNVSEGHLILEVQWVQNFMYALDIKLFSKNTGLRSIFKKVKEEYIYGFCVFKSDRIEKYGHQILRITEDSPMIRLKRLNELQGDGVLNWNFFDKLGIEIKSSLPLKRI